MTESNKKGLLIVVVVVALAAAVYSVFNFATGPKVEVVGTMPQASKAQEQAAADAAAQAGRPEMPRDDAVRTGMDPADMEGNPKGKG